ncbi:MAG: Holliday junction branch migration protein RuvA [bacterium]
MIDRIEGEIIALEPTNVVVDVGGVGFFLSISLQTYERIGTAKRFAFFTHLHVREDILALYGFADAAERQAFRILIGISGVGPRVAQAILSSVTVETLREAIAAGDWKRLTAAPGIGRKLAERMTVELRGKFGEPPGGLEAGTPSGYSGETGTIYEAVQALIALGHNPTNAEKLARDAAKRAGEGATVQDLIRAALKP